MFGVAYKSGKAVGKKAKKRLTVTDGIVLSSSERMRTLLERFTWRGSGNALYLDLGGSYIGVYFRIIK